MVKASNKLLSRFSLSTMIGDKTYIGVFVGLSLFVLSLLALGSMYRVRNDVLHNKQKVLSDNKFYFPYGNYGIILKKW